MKWFLGILLLISAIKVQALPNLEGSLIYDFENREMMTGVTSKLVGYKDLQFRIGYTEKGTWISGFSYDLKNLEKLGADVKYFWDDWNLTVGIGAGYNYTTGNLSFIASSVLVQINF